MGKRPVAGQDQHAGGILVKPPGRHAAHGRVHRRQQIQNRTLLFVPGSGQDP